MTAVFYEDDPPPKPRAFLSELARLLILQGLDVDAKTRGGRLTISCQIRTPDGKRAGFQHEWLAADFEDPKIEPKNLAWVWSERFCAQLPAAPK